MPPPTGSHPEGDLATTYLSWLSLKATDADGNVVGTVHGVYMDRRTDAAEWLAILTGRLTTKLVLVPAADASRSGDEVRFDHPRDVLLDAPDVSPSGDLSIDDERRTFRYYGREDDDQMPVDRPIGPVPRRRRFDRGAPGSLDVATGQRRLYEYAETAAGAGPASDMPLKSRPDPSDQPRDETPPHVESMTQPSPAERSAAAEHARTQLRLAQQHIEASRRAIEAAQELRRQATAGTAAAKR
jgi:hypothetical protein